MNDHTNKSLLNCSTPCLGFFFGFKWRKKNPFLIFDDFSFSHKCLSGGFFFSAAAMMNGNH